MSKRKETSEERIARQKRMYRGVVMAIYSERREVVEALKSNGFELCRNGRHVVIYRNPDSNQKVNVPYKISDRNLARKILKTVGLTL